MLVHCVYDWNRFFLPLISFLWSASCTPYIYIYIVYMVKSVWLHDGDILTREVVEQSHSKE